MSQGNIVGDIATDGSSHHELPIPYFVFCSMSTFNPGGISVAI